MHRWCLTCVNCLILYVFIVCCRSAWELPSSRHTGHGIGGVHNLWMLPRWEESVDLWKAHRRCECSIDCICLVMLLSCSGLDHHKSAGYVFMLFYATIQLLDYVGLNSFSILSRLSTARTIYRDCSLISFILHETPSYPPARRLWKGFSRSAGLLNRSTCRMCVRKSRRWWSK